MLLTALLLSSLALPGRALPAPLAGLAKATTSEPQQRGQRRGGQRGQRPARGAGRGGGSLLGGGGRPKAKTKPKPGRDQTPRGKGNLLGPGEDKQKQVDPAKGTPVDPEVIVAEEIKGFFGIADYDANEWLSFSEARASLEFDRPRYQSYDKDRDGRLRLGEFKRFYDDSLKYGTGFQPPRAQDTTTGPPKRTPEQLRIAYDQDLDLQISVAELERLLVDYDKQEVPADQVLRTLDGDHDDRLALGELPELLEILHPVVLPESDRATAEDRPTTADELFGLAEPRGLDAGATPYPPYIAGPVSQFRRLDLDNDGEISIADLEGLLRPVQTSIRTHSVLNTLDLNGDGVLDREEFLRALIDADDF